METTAHLFKALSEETRLRILALLTTGELCVCNLMAVLALPQSTISRHLAYLRNAGWVQGRRQGVWMYYRLSEGSSSFQQGLADFLNQALPGLPLAQKDRQALLAHLESKQQSACG